MCKSDHFLMAVSENLCFQTFNDVGVSNTFSCKIRIVRVFQSKIVIITCFFVIICLINQAK